MMAVIKSSSVSNNKAVVPSTNQTSKKPTTTTKYGAGGSVPVFVFGIDIDDELGGVVSPSPCGPCRWWLKATVNILSPVGSTLCTIDSSTPVGETFIAPSKAHSTTAPLSAPENMPSTRTGTTGEDAILNQTCSDKKETNLACRNDDGQDDNKLPAAAAAAEPLPFKLQHDPLGLLLFGISN